MGVLRKQESRGKSTQPEANAPSLLKCVKQTPSSQKWLRVPKSQSHTLAKCDDAKQPRVGQQRLAAEKLSFTTGSVKDEQRRACGASPGSQLLKMCTKQGSRRRVKFEEAADVDPLSCDDRNR